MIEYKSGERLGYIKKSPHSLECVSSMLVVRSIAQVLDLNVVSAIISGIAGVGHIILGISLMLILFDIKKSCIK